MTTRFLRSFCVTFLAATLCACGGTDYSGDGAGASLQTAAATHAVDVSIDPASVGKTPEPDCADQACAGLRIIDGNA